MPRARAPQKNPVPDRERSATRPPRPRTRAAPPTTRGRPPQRTPPPSPVATTADAHATGRPRDPQKMMKKNAWPPSSTTTRAPSRDTRVQEGVTRVLEQPDTHSADRGADDAAPGHSHLETAHRSGRFARGSRVTPSHRRPGALPVALPCPQNRQAQERPGPDRWSTSSRQRSSAATRSSSSSNARGSTGASTSA
jgi:hypothetical protein